MRKIATLVVAFFVAGVSTTQSVFGGPSAPAAGVPTKPFVDTDKLPPSYKGYDLRAFIGALQKRPRPQKSEFETQARYEERLGAWMAVPLRGAVLPESRVAFSGGASMASDNEASVKYRYNAETQTFTFWAHPECDGEPGLMVDASKTKFGTYVGQNAYGIKRSITRIKQEVICLRTTPEIAVDSESFGAPPHEAVMLSSLGRLLVVGTLAAGVVTETRDRSTPTIDYPEDVVRVVKSLTMVVDEVWLYDPITGAIYGKWRQRRK